MFVNKMQMAPFSPPLEKMKKKTPPCQACAGVLNKIPISDQMDDKTSLNNPETG